MLRQPESRQRRGATVVECALVYPVVFVFILGLIVGGMGVFRYQEVASLARDASRYASLHGASYAQATGKAATTSADVYTNAILPNVAALDISKLPQSNVTVTWKTPNGTTTTDQSKGNTVTVTVNYNWVPELFLPSMTLSSTSTETILY
jgi:Flp pilus assembly protein TadG